MKRNVTIACAGVAAIGLAIVSTVMMTGGKTSKYSSTGEKFTAPMGMSEEGATGAAQWWFDRVKDENGNLPLAEMRNTAYRAHQAMVNSQNQMSAQATSWTELGPDNVGGRTRGLIMDNSNNQHFFAGGVGGGLWESTDGCNNWIRCAGYWNVPGVNLNVACIAQAPNGDIYVGTGEGMYTFFASGAGGFVGDGIYKSTDHGATFTHLTATAATANNSTANWAATNKICVDPNNSNRVYAATNNGLWVTTDGGTTWATAPNIAITANLSDVDMNGQGVIIASVNGDPWRSADDGASFSNVGSSAFGFYNLAASRTELDFAPSDPNYIYAMVAANNSAQAGAYFSSNAGATWSQVAGAGNAQMDIFNSSQGSYDNVIEVDPFDKTNVIPCGVELWRFTLVTASPAAGQWTRIAVEFPNSPFIPWYVHSDKHAITFDPTTQGRWFVGSDGGVARTVNDGATYVQMNSGYNVTQAYSVGIQNTDLNRDEMMMGTQDNGTQYIDGMGNTQMSAFATGGGDGGHCEISLLNPLAQFITVYYGAVSRSNNDGQSSADFYDTRLAASTSLGTPPFASFITPIRLWESFNDPLSTDSVLIDNGWHDLTKHVTDGATSTYTDVLAVAFPQSSPAATIDLASVKFYCGTGPGTDSAQANGIGVFSGDATGSVDAQGNYTITWNQTPSANKVIRAVFTVSYGAGSLFTLNSNVSGRIFTHTLGSTLLAGATLKIQDPIQSRLAVGYTSNNGVWVIKRPLDFSTNPFWYKIGGTLSLPSAFTGTTSCMAWSANGNHLFVATESGSLYRFSNISAIVDKYNGDLDTAGQANIVTTCTRIYAGSRWITSVDCDPNNANNVIISLGSYSQTQYVFYSSSATTDGVATGVGSFQNKTGSGGTGLHSQGGVPVYSVCFDKYDPGRVLIGSEHGIYETANITAAAPQWTYASSPEMGMVATDMIRQQRWDPWHVPNAGCFYAGTHGRGGWRDDSSWQQPTSINEPGAPINNGSSGNNDIRVFPNPVIENSNVTFMLPQNGDATIEIYDLSGKLVSSQNYEQLQAGSNTVQFGTENLVKGTYIISVTQKGKKIGTGRFLKMN